MRKRTIVAAATAALSLLVPLAAAGTAHAAPAARSDISDALGGAVDALFEEMTTVGTPPDGYVRITTSCNINTTMRGDVAIDYRWRKDGSGYPTVDARLVKYKITDNGRDEGNVQFGLDTAWPGGGHADYGYTKEYKDAVQDGYWHLLDRSISGHTVTAKGTATFTAKFIFDEPGHDWSCKAQTTVSPW